MLIWGLLATAATVESASRYYDGGCRDENYYAGDDMLCKVKCKSDVVGRASKKRPLKWIMETENSFAADITLKGKAYTKNKKPYIGLVRFDKKHCGNKILEAIENGHLRVDFGDKGDKNYFVESITYVKEGGAKTALMMQFRKKSVSGVTDLWNSKLKVDRFFMTMSGFAEGYTNMFAGIEPKKIKTCFFKAFFLTMPNDKEGNMAADYTKCALYNHYGMDIDWEEEPPTETTPTMTSEMTTETTEYTTEEPIDDGDNLIPEGVKCQGNPVSSKIVGGDDAKPHSWPWIVRVRLGWSSCGGTILNNNHVMCAAHCCEGKDASSTYITVGEHDTTDSNDGNRQVQATEIFVHEKYGENDGFTYNWDFCIIRTEPMNLDGKNSDIVCLPKQGEHVEPTNEGERLKGKLCYVGGWGTLASGGSTPTVLQSVKIDIFSHKFCKAQSSYGNRFDEESEFCAGKMEGGQDSCQGDSGGPVICIDGKNQPVLYGVVSWGFGCAASKYPGIYGKVAAIVDWIDVVVNNKPTTPPVTTTPVPDEEQLIPEGTRCTGGNDFSRSSSKIIGGETTAKGSWSWIAHIKIGSRLCAGTIINENFVLTAAHCCVDADSPSDIVLKVGEHDISTSGDGEKRITVREILVHKKWFDSDSYTYNYDVCLLKTDDVGINGNTVDVVCLPQQGEHVAPTGHIRPGKTNGDRCWVAGWGTIELGGDYPNKLQSFKPDVYSQSYCAAQSSYTENSWDPSNEFCAGKMEGGQDACSGDAGAPLVCLDDKNQPYLYGIATWGRGCAYDKYPGMYAMISSHIDWIGSQVDPSQTTVPPSTEPPGDDSNLIPDGTKCKGNALNRIVNGDDAKKNSWPWIVGVRMGGYMCGGSILSKNWVMTAAHCCDGFGASSIYVIAGDHNNQVSDGEKRYNAKQVVMHPKYGESDGFTYNYDFCLLEVETIELDAQTKDIVCLPEQGAHVLPTNDGERLKGRHCFVGGWGTTASGGGLSQILQSVRIDIFSHKFCKRESSYGSSFDEVSEFCAGKMKGGVDSCQGDSGGPLICIDDEGQPVLYGVVSWGYGCAYSGYPGIYAKVSAIVDWIVETAV